MVKAQHQKLTDDNKTEARVAPVTQAPKVNSFPAPTSSPPAFAGVRAGPGQKFAVEWVKTRLRAIHTEARAAGRDSPLNEAAAFLYLLIATYVLSDRFISEPIVLQDLARIMQCKSITVRRARQLLTLLGELELIAGGQGNTEVRFALVKMAWGGPLYAENGGVGASATSISSDRSCRVPRSPQIEVRNHPGSRTSIAADRSTHEPRSPEIEDAAADYMYLEEEGTAAATTRDGDNETIIDGSMSVDEQRAALVAAAAADEDQADRFCCWWAAAYPSYNEGVQNRVRECDRQAAFSLMYRRTVEFVQKMAIEMWAPAGHYNDSDLRYLATSDKSIRVLLEKATVIEREVVRLERLEARRQEQSAAGGRREQGLAEHVDRVRARLQLIPPSNPPTSLDEAIARITIALSTLEQTERQDALDRLNEWDLDLLRAARAIAGDEILQRMRLDADLELADFRKGMALKSYERACEATVDRLVRQHFHLPVVSWS